MSKKHKDKLLEDVKALSCEQSCFGSSSTPLVAGPYI